MYVTNLGSFPSHFNIILVPDGDFDANHTKFVLNLNMKRFSCSGRSALTLAAPRLVVSRVQASRALTCFL